MHQRQNATEEVTTMSWTDFHRRNDAINAVLQHARRTAEATLPWHLPEVSAVFRSPQELVNALHYKWALLVTAHMDCDMFEENRTPVYAARHAEHLAAEEEPMLRELIEANQHMDTCGADALEAQYLGMAGRRIAALGETPA